MPVGVSNSTNRVRSRSHERLPGRVTPWAEIRNGIFKLPTRRTHNLRFPKLGSAVSVEESLGGTFTVLLGLRDRPQLDTLDSDPFRALLVWAKSKPSIAPYGREIIGISAKPIGFGAASQPLILRGERSGLLTRIATTESVSLCVRTKS